jgi:peptidoglycan/xylan/chitin deacetylase (PgdA/CDA1 family)
MKRFTSLVMHHPIFARSVELLGRLDDHRPNMLRVLTYHRVSESYTGSNRLPSITVSTENFAQQMGLLRAKYLPISIKELIRAYQDGHTLAPGAVLVTFDDAYCDFKEYAWKILKQYEIPCLLFVPTAYPDHPEKIFWWDQMYNAFRNTRHQSLDASFGKFHLSTPDQRNQAFFHSQDQVKLLPHSRGLIMVDEIIKQLDVDGFSQPILSWNDLRQLAKDGLDLGAHSQTHPLFNRISIEEVQAEVEGSLSDLKREIGSFLPVFAYPGGNLNEQVIEVLKKAGIQLGFTTRRGINDLNNANPLQLRRINVGMRTSMAALHAQLLTWSRICNR